MQHFGPFFFLKIFSNSKTLAPGFDSVDELQRKLFESQKTVEKQAQDIQQLEKKLAEKSTTTVSIAQEAHTTYICRQCSGICT
jgi:uncharacterized coiled-coil protein SlyX